LQVGRRAAEYLLNRGHRHLAVVNLDPVYQKNHMSDRCKQFVKAGKDMASSINVLQTEEQHDLNKRPAHIIERKVDELLALNPRPSGVFVVVDGQLLQLYNALYRHGIEPLQEFHLIGCNNDPAFMAQMHPRPATVDIRLKAVGSRAVEQLLWRIEHPQEKSRAEIFIQPEVIPDEEAQDPKSENKKRENSAESRNDKLEHQLLNN